MRIIFILLLLLITISSHGQNSKKEILLIGTFHFNNPGQDVAKVKAFSVMTDQSQKELEYITEKIKKFNPDKIFVEWDYKEQTELDSLYNLYRKDAYTDYIEKKYPKSSFYKQNEIFQLAFRAAKKSNNTRVYAIDYKGTDFPYDSLMRAIDQANQVTLKNDILNTIKEFERQENENRLKLNLTKLILKLNEEEYRQFDAGAYISLFNSAGDKNNFVGAYLVSEWYKRNLFMYSLIQKITESKDDKVMVLLGASHAAIIQEFIKLDDNFKLVELKDIL